MNLLDEKLLLKGQKLYRQDAKGWKFTLDIEKAAKDVCGLITKYGDQPTQSALDDAYNLLIQIEVWKMMCMEERIGNAKDNSKRLVWDAFRGALKERIDRVAILSIMNLKGFGSKENMNFGGLRPAKVASAAMRFLLPETWGVVDWRTAAILDRLNKTNGDLGKALALCTDPVDVMRAYYMMINEDKACEYNQMYRDSRTPSFPRVADLEMAIFGLSFPIW